MADATPPATSGARPCRPSTGRARNEQARRDILDAALDLARHGSTQASIDEIARHAGVGKQTIYRWWPSKSALLLDALLDHAGRTVNAEPSGPLECDLVRFLRSTFQALIGPCGTAPLVRTLMAEAQLDPDFRQQWRTEFVEPRRQALIALIEAGVHRREAHASLDTALLADVLYGAMWYRLLVGHAPLVDHYADHLAHTAQLLVADAVVDESVR